MHFFLVFISLLFKFIDAYNYIILNAHNVSQSNYIFVWIDILYWLCQIIIAIVAFNILQYPPSLSWT